MRELYTVWSHQKLFYFKNHIKITVYETFTLTLSLDSDATILQCNKL